MKDVELVLFPTIVLVVVHGNLWKQKGDMWDAVEEFHRAGKVLTDLGMHAGSQSSEAMWRGLNIHSGNYNLPLPRVLL